MLLFLQSITSLLSSNAPSNSRVKGAGPPASRTPSHRRETPHARGKGALAQTSSSRNSRQEAGCLPWLHREGARGSTALAHLQRKERGERSLLRTRKSHGALTPVPGISSQNRESGSGCARSPTSEQTSVFRSLAAFTNNQCPTSHLGICCNHKHSVLQCPSV